ncbi:MAG TPA: methyltransferase domain-containing protein [Marmoricola sp.]
MDGPAARLTPAPTVHCDYYDAFRCRSCSLLEQPYAEQVRAKQAHCASLIPAPRWEPAITGPEQGFRNKAKLAVGGTVDEPTLGILDDDRRGVDLRDCGLHTAGLRAAIPVIGDFLTRARLAPYDVNVRRGELKNVLMTESPDGELMVRFVLRSREAEARIRKHLARLTDALPVRVASLNLQPDHKAVLEGPEEVVLTDDAVLPMRLATGVTLHLRPQSFFQTNTGIATALYDTARRWVGDLDPRSVWDLYCGVGGFALHLAAPGREVTGVEISAEAVEGAAESAGVQHLDARFVAGDVLSEWSANGSAGSVDLVVVNPPRRGIGTELAQALEQSQVRTVLYSSCRAETLARDLESMPSLRPERAVLLDMFPQTGHYEALTLLRRG